MLEIQDARTTHATVNYIKLPSGKPSLQFYCELVAAVVHTAVANGRFTCIIDGILPEDILEELYKKGYSVESQKNLTKISW